MNDDKSNEKRSVRKPLGRAGLLIVVGLVIQAFTLVWSHPTAFLVWAGLGGTLVVLGILLYLWIVLKAQPPVETRPRRP